MCSHAPPHTAPRAPGQPQSACQAIPIEPSLLPWITHSHRHAPRDVQPALGIQCPLPQFPRCSSRTHSGTPGSPLWTHGHLGWAQGTPSSTHIPSPQPPCTPEPSTTPAHTCTPCHTWCAHTPPLLPLPQTTCTHTLSPSLGAKTP